ncbi:L-rhamnose/proton symporter RhaT [Reichenbachiella carrageenanivorans]|uniref:L-rhamnose/proton symporter RhaT n=1 Tax=Reichenbachiella carrageenanivorans TaxID=2979869 RepID=A0ABY6D4D7_9BACT|nr:L-rhamnose/proton symporter RhaT [Reichenbachiella carrageenanivorans]UXX81010.1 L-rhamnose/proton symporter RhaT [Reichenbachiella carrageenanivorans]
MGAIIGICLHAVGGLCAGSFYTPIKKIETWAWESSWLVMGFFAWLIVPWLMASITVTDLMHTLLSSPSSAIGWTFFFGFVWGAGGPIFNLTMRYLGVSLGMTVSLGSGAAFGTLIPPLVSGQFGELLHTTAGQITFGGVMVCLIGIALAGYAGHQRDLARQQDDSSSEKFNTGKGILITFLSGPIGACFAYGLAAGKPIADAAMAQGTPTLWQNNAVLTVLLLGGLSSNFILCVYNNYKKKTAGDYLKNDGQQRKNYLLASLGGSIWYLQFMFYGMGSSFLEERFHFASWTVHMSFIILFGNLWGLYFKEWKGVKSSTVQTLIFGLLILAASTILIAWGSS